jgi:hypothetical protein
MKFSDLAIGCVVCMVENMSDERSSEVRCTYYEVGEGFAVFSPKFRPAYRLQTIQGTIGESPRYNTGYHRWRTEVPDALPVISAQDSPWGLYFMESLKGKT